MDQFATALEHRLRTYELISSQFGCLRKQIAESNLIEVYKDGLDEGLSLGSELVQFVDFVIALKDEQIEDVSREHFV